jgi:predicted transcriptional regulator
MNKTIIVDVTGDNAYATAKERIDQYTNGTDADSVDRIRVELEINGGQRQQPKRNDNNTKHENKDSKINVSIEKDSKGYIALYDLYVHGPDITASSLATFSNLTGDELSQYFYRFRNHGLVTKEGKKGHYRYSVTVDGKRVVEQYGEPENHD